MRNSHSTIAVLCSVVVTACGGGDPGSVGGGPFFGESDATLSLAIADFDDDGLDDIAAGRYRLMDVGVPFPGWIDVLLQDNLSPGSFVSSGTEGVEDRLWSIVSADLDADGYDDLIATSSQLSALSIVMNNSTSPGNFLPATTLGAGSGSDGVAVADLNGDGAVDIAVADKELSVFYQDVANPGTYSRTTFRSASLPHVGNIALGDFNFDGRKDMIVITSNSTGRTDGIELWLQDSVGAFAPGNRYGVSDQPTSLTVADINNDGFDDAAVGSQEAAMLTVFLNNPGVPGTLVVSGTYATCQPGEAVAITDVNNDNLPDVIMSGHRNGEACMAVHLQNSAGNGSLQAADYYTGDGVVSAYSVDTGDLNGDGLIDIAIADSGIAAFFQNPATPGTFQSQVRILDDD